MKKLENICDSQEYKILMEATRKGNLLNGEVLKALESCSNNILKKSRALLKEVKCISTIVKEKNNLTISQDSSLIYLP